LADGAISGLAHLLEHMLFVQSKKYGPKEYHNFIGTSSGSSNAYTSNDKTVYYFNVPDVSFDKAFDMFAQFFVGPSFDRGAVEREVSAVHRYVSLGFSVCTCFIIYFVLFFAANIQRISMLMFGDCSK
jgi:secreted Zn-dependent insulinase-like peptidase